MSSVAIPSSDTQVTSSRRRSRVRATVIRRIESTLSTWVSPFERWSDDNYAPLHLGYVAHSTDDAFEIVAELHGFAPSEVFVDLHRGHVILLLSRASSGEAELREYYNEVPIPADVRANKAQVQITSNMLIVRLQKYPAVVRPLIAPMRRLFRLMPS